MTGRLITFEGIDGVGKSTHSVALAEHLRSRGIAVEMFREPGGTPVGESLRRIIKAGEAEHGVAELLLFAAARTELVEQRLKPLLAEGRVIILDRFTDSSIAYQGALDDVPDSVLVSICLAAAGGLYPDLTFWFDLDPETALQRRGAGAGQPALPLPGGGPVPDAIERRTVEYFNRVRDRYISIQHSDPERVLRVDCSGTIDETWETVRKLADTALAKWQIGLSMNGATD